MQSRSSQNRLSGSAPRSRVSPLFLTMLATMATVYVAGRLWQDAEIRAYLIQELDERASQDQSVLSADDGALKSIPCSEQQRKLSALETELNAARQEGFILKNLTKNDEARPTRNLLAVIGIITTFGRRKNRDAIRKAWMPTGSAIKKLADEKGIIVQFVIGRSSKRGDSLDREIEEENRQTNDFVVLEDPLESPEERPRKIKSFLIHAVENWDAKFIVKVNDDVFVNIDALGAILNTHLDKRDIYIGCMKSGRILTEPTNKRYEPDWWKFGDANSYFRHASGEIYAISRHLAQYISINRSILRTYACDAVSVGSWFIGLDIDHIDEQKLCCLSQSEGSVCANAW